MQLIQANNLPNGLTLCLRPEGGALILGEDFEHTRVNYQWTPLTSRSLYTVKLNDVGMPSQGFEGGMLGFSDAAAILDSATTNIVFPAAKETTFKNALKAMCSQRKMKGICDASPSIWTNYIQLTEEDIAKFPGVIFYIDGLARALLLTPEFYLSEYNGYYIMNIDFEGTKTILGNGFMKAYRIAVDLVSRQVGFGNMLTCPGGPNPPLPTDEDTYRIMINTSFTGFKFADPKGLVHSRMCGGVAPHSFCLPTDPTCGKLGATKPRWDHECDDMSIFGLGFETEARFGKPMNRTSPYSAIIATRDIAMPVDLPVDKPFLFATIKYFNPRLVPETAPSQVTLRTTVDFTTPGRVDNYAAFSFDVTLNITHFGRCRANGCPWNDPKSWPNRLHNKKCKDGQLADGTPCCPYWTNRNLNNYCASLVQLGSLYDPNMRAAELNGELYKIFFIGFHEDSHEHLNDRRLYEFFTADSNAITAANLHARLIPMCPQCPPGTEREVYPDGSCTCKCASSCELPAVNEPDCSCTERISEDAACNYFCDSNDVASIPCFGGSLYVVAGGGRYKGTTLPPSPPCTRGGSGDLFKRVYASSFSDGTGGSGGYGDCGSYDDMHCECVCSTSCPPGTYQNADCTCACAACPDNKCVDSVLWPIGSNCNVGWPPRVVVAPAVTAALLVTFRTLTPAPAPAPPVAPLARSRTATARARALRAALPVRCSATTASAAAPQRARLARPRPATALAPALPAAVLARSRTATARARALLPATPARFRTATARARAPTSARPARSSTATARAPALPPAPLARFRTPTAAAVGAPPAALLAWFRCTLRFRVYKNESTDDSIGLRLLHLRLRKRVPRWSRSRRYRLRLPLRVRLPRRQGAGPCLVRVRVR